MLSSEGITAATARAIPVISGAGGAEGAASLRGDGGMMDAEGGQARDVPLPLGSCRDASAGKPAGLALASDGAGAWTLYRRAANCWSVSPAEERGGGVGQDTCQAASCSGIAV